MVKIYSLEKGLGARQRTWYVKRMRGTPLVVQQLRLHAPKAGALGSIPGQGTGPLLPQMKDPACGNKDLAQPSKFFFKKRGGNKE